LDLASKDHLTCNILVKDIILLQSCAHQLLDMVIDDEQLPLPGWLHLSDDIKKACREPKISVVFLLSKAIQRTVTGNLN